MKKSFVCAAMAILLVFGITIIGCVDDSKGKITNLANETVDGLAYRLEAGDVQRTLEEIIRNNEAIMTAAVYSGDGLIMGHYVPERVGKMLLDVDTQYGRQIQEINEAVLNGKPMEGSYYSAVLGEDILFALVPIETGNSGTRWSIMVGSTKSSLKNYKG